MVEMRQHTMTFWGLNCLILGAQAILPLPKIKLIIDKCDDDYDYDGSCHDADEDVSSLICLVVRATNKCNIQTIDFVFIMCASACVLCTRSEVYV